MGRELRRVPVDFSHPVGQAWPGFLNEHYQKSSKCTHCDGTGASPGMRELQARWYGYIPFRPEDRGSTPFLWTHPSVQERAKRNIQDHERILRSDPVLRMSEALRLCSFYNSSWSHHLNQQDVDALVAAGRLMDLTHEWNPETRWTPKVPAHHPTATEVNEWSLRGIGHDSINQWIVCGAEADRLGIKHECEHCDGDGRVWASPEDCKAYEEWGRTPPPTGDGYQIWETVSEGSPISPVFSTAQGLATYMAGRPWGADKGSSYDSWMKFIEGPGWAPSMIVCGGVMSVGPEAIA